MTSAIPVAVIGAGRHATELARHAAPLPGVTILRWAPAPLPEDPRQSADLASHFGIVFSTEWQEVIDDPAITALLILADLPRRTSIVMAGLNAGKVVVCPFPAAVDAASLSALTEAQRRGPGILLSLSEIAGTSEGKHAIQELQEGRLGRLHSLWAGVRGQRDDLALESVLDQHAWPVLDFLLAGISNPVLRVHADLATLFEAGPHHDTAIILIRFEGDVVATIELSRCLPPSIPAGAMGEVEIEAIGARGVIRIAPYSSAVRVYGKTSVVGRPWTDGALFRALPKIAAAARSGKPDEDCLGRASRAIGIMDSIRNQTRG